MTAELVEFLNARLDVVEAAALELAGEAWHIGNAVDPTQPCHVHTFPSAKLVADGLNWLVAEHMALNDPESVLRRCAADRKSVRLYADTLAILERSRAEIQAARDRGDQPSGKVLNGWGEANSELAVMGLFILNMAEGYGWNENKSAGGGSQ